MKLLELQRDPRLFRDRLLIDTDRGPQPLSSVLDDWQRADFEALDAGWKRAVIGMDHEAQHQRAWLERPRGHSKTQDLAVMATWALFAARRRLSGVAAAGDQDQARLLRDAIGKLTAVNPWLAKIIEVQSYRIVNRISESTLEVLSSDAPTSYGLTPDFIIADEVTHWRKRDLWDSLISSAAKRATCMFVVIANAGIQDDWAWQTREAVRTDPSWMFSRLPGPVASWITPDRLDEQRRLLPAAAYARLWLNEWSTGGGDALSRADIDHAFKPNLQPMPQARTGWEFVAGLDLGVSRDASALCVLAVRTTRQGDDPSDHGRIRLAATKVWRPSKGQRIDLAEVERTLLAVHSRYALRQVNFDPWQATHMAQRLRVSSLPMAEVTSTPKNLQAQATALIEKFSDRQLDLYFEPDLHRDLCRLRVEERQYGFRVVSPRDEHGHGDLCSAFALALLAASEIAAKPRITVANFLERKSRFSDVALYAREMEDLARGGSNDTAEGFARLMYGSGWERRL